MIYLNILYSTGCPKCEILIKKLKDANINYELCTDNEIMISKGFTFVPMFETDGKIMDFKTTFEWINEGTED